MKSFPSFESLPPTIVCADVDKATEMESAPSLPNSTSEPTASGEKSESFSVPPLTVPVLPVRSSTVSLPESPVTVARPLPVRIVSSPARPTMVPGPVSLDWFRVSFPAVPVAAYAMVVLPRGRRGPAIRDAPGARPFPVPRRRLSLSGRVRSPQAAPSPQIDRKAGRVPGQGLPPT